MTVLAQGAVSIRVSFLHVLKAHLDIFAVGGIDLPQGAGGKVEQPGDDDVGELLDADVVDGHRVVVVLAAVSDHILQFGDSLTQALKGGVGFQIGIALHHHEK